MNDRRSRLERNLVWILLVMLLFGCLMVMRPFISALLWSMVLSFSVWPLYSRLLKAVQGRRTLAAGLMTLAIVLVMLMPFAIVGATLAQNIQELSAALKQWLAAGPPSPPAWLARVPVIGPAAVEKWQILATDSASLIEEAKRFIEPVSEWFLKAGFKLGRGLFDLALSILITFFFLRDGLSLADRLITGVSHIAGEQGKHLLGVAGNTVRGVVYGILGTALVQAVVAGVGFLIAGVPGASLLALMTFFLSVVPVGPPLVWIPAALWLFHKDAIGWGIFMVIWGFGVSSVDNVVKPWIISHGSAMPFLLIFFGVVGGALAFGFIGVFIGPTLLAVSYRLVEEWIASKRQTAAATDAGGADKAGTT